MVFSSFPIWFLLTSFASLLPIFPHLINCSLERRFVLLDQRRYGYPAREFVYELIVRQGRIGVDLFDDLELSIAIRAR